MPKLNFVQKAQKNIYTHGKYVEYESKKGKRAGQMKTKLDRTVPNDETDTIYIAQGESYYWWQFKNGGKNISKTKPRRSQLTQSSFLSTLYDIEDRIAEFECDNKDDFDSFKDEILSDIESLKEECESSLENIPESLKYAPTGEMLQERIDNLDSWYSEIESVEDIDYDEEEVKSEAENDNPREEGESDDDYEQRIQEKVNDAIQEKVNDAIDELKNTSSGC